MATDLIPQYFLTKSALDLCGGPGETRGYPREEFAKCATHPAPMPTFGGLQAPSLYALIPTFDLVSLRTYPHIRTDTPQKNLVAKISVPP